MAAVSDGAGTRAIGRDGGAPPTGRRFLFQVRNRRGLGHLMRGLNIARALRALDPRCEILFHLRAAPPPGLWPADLHYAVEDDSAAPRDWPAVLAEFAPQVVIYDTMLPPDAAAEPLAADAKYVYIMRRCLPEEQRAVFGHPFLARMALILVPHTAEQFGYRLPADIASRARFVGPIVRLPAAAAQAALRGKYGIRPGDFVLTSTVGGGGFAEQADAFFAAVFAAHRELHGALPGLRHIVVQGPNYAGRLAAPPGVTLVEFEPAMIDLLALSDLAVAEGGYNTVNEIRITRTPAIFLPGTRGKDDQAERVRALEAAGLAIVIAPPDAARLARCVRSLAGAPQALAAMRARYAGEPTEVGNRAAAAALLELLA